ncbi:MAG: hypothetical protein OWU32_05510 [Firmicutes bacterium]|nr:hypothetical protein [Bacillota bacterium]
MSLLWAASSLLIVTWLPATVAVAAGLQKVDAGYAAALREYRQVFSRYLIVGLLLGLPVLLSLFVTLIDLVALVHLGRPGISVLYAGLLVCLDVLLAGTTLQGAASLSLAADHSWRAALILGARRLWRAPLKTLAWTCLMACLIAFGMRLPLFAAIAGGALQGKVLQKVART